MITTVEIGDRRVAVATARGAAGGVQTASAELPSDFTERSPSDRASAIRTAMQACGVNGRKFVLVVPRRHAILRDFTLPPGDPEETQQMIRFQLERDLPVPVEDVALSYSTVEQDGGKIRVDAVAIPKTILDPVLSALDEAGYKPSGVHVSSFGLPAFASEDRDPSAVVSVAGNLMELVITDGGRHIFSRSAKIGEESGEQIAMEVERSLLSFASKHPDREVREVKLAAGGEDARTLAASISRHLGKSVETYDRGECRPEMASAAGISMALARWPEQIPDVLHPPVVKKKFKITKGHRVGAIVASGFLLMLFLMHFLLSDLRAELDLLETQLEDIEPRVEAVQTTLDRTRLAQKWGNQRFSWVDYLADLSNRMNSRKQVLLSFAVEESGSVRFSGKASAKEAINELLSELRSCEYFRDVKFRDARENNDKSSYRWNFSIDGHLEGFEMPKKGGR
jgi:Tfp pilus assembly PilM family ATPase